MNIPEIVAFHQTFRMPNVIDHLILNFCKDKAMTVHELYTEIYHRYSVVSYKYIDKRVTMLRKHGLLCQDVLYGSDRPLYSLTDWGEKYLSFMDFWLVLNTKKIVGNVTSAN